MTNTTLTNGTATLTLTFVDTDCYLLRNSRGEAAHIGESEARSRVATLLANGWRRA